MKLLKRAFIFLLFVIMVGISSLSAQNYYVYVAAESEDQVYLIHYDAETQQANIAETIEVGRYPTETDGPHGMTVAPDGKHWFVSIAHGNPYGYLAKYRTGTNELVQTTELGMFPASMEISTATDLLYVVNFNLHGDMVPSTVSVVEPKTMTRVEEITTGIMPHGSRITEDGRSQYHVSMMTDELMEINTTQMEISRKLNVVTGKSGELEDMTNRKNEHKMASPKCKPTWAHPHPEKKLVYVACNGSDTIKEINTKSWSITRTFDAGKDSAPYNLEVSYDGKYVVASYKGAGATGIWDLETGEEVTQIINSRDVTHGVTITPDSRFAFISVEGIGGEPGSVDVINLETLERVSVIEVGKQAGGIIFWKTTDPS